MFRRRRWFQGRPIHGTNVSDIGWFTPGGVEMSDQDWQAGFAKSLGVFLNGRGIPTPNERGEQVVDDSFYVMFNASHEPVEFTLPEAKWGQRWVELLETDRRSEELEEEARRCGAHRRRQGDDSRLVAGAAAACGLRADRGGAAQAWTVDAGIRSALRHSEVLHRCSGKRHVAGRETVRAIEHAMAGRARAGQAAVVATTA